MVEISKYFPSLSASQIAQYERIEAIYKEWNEKINVVSRKDIEALYTHHVLHSLSLAKVIQFVPGTRLLDVGTGGGFPGIPLAIMFPNCHFHLVDSIGKKIKVVKSVAETLGLQNVTTEQRRAETLTSTYDFVLSRGVTSLKELLIWNGKNITKTSKNSLENGFLVLKGGDNLINEISEIHKHVKTTLISTFFADSYFAEKKVVYIKW